MPEKRTIPRACRSCGTAYFITTAKAKAGLGTYCSPRCGQIKRSPDHAVAFLDDGSARIPLYARDGNVVGYSTVDAADAAVLDRWTWRLTLGYAKRGQMIDGQFRHILMHRAILGLTHGDGLEGDHINRDKLDNRRENLRIVTPHGQKQNVPSRRNSSSRFRGVSFFKRTGRWIAHVRVNGKSMHLGYFATELEAADAARIGRSRFMPYAID
jgi:hypothetical protein